MKIRAIRRNCTFCRSLFSLLFHDMICVTVYVFRAAMSKIALKKVCSISKNLLTKAPVCSIITYVAGITQLVEYLTRNEEVEGSSPFSSSQKSAANGLNERVSLVARQAEGSYYYGLSCLNSFRLSSDIHTKNCMPVRR